MKNLLEYLFIKEGLSGIWQIKIWPFLRGILSLLTQLVTSVSNKVIKFFPDHSQDFESLGWFVWGIAMILIKWLLFFMMVILFIAITLVIIVFYIPMAIIVFLIYGLKGIQELNESITSKDNPTLWGLKYYYLGWKEFPLSGISILIGVFLVGAGMMATNYSKWTRGISLLIGLLFFYLSFIKLSQNDKKPSLQNAI